MISIAAHRTQQVLKVSQASQSVGRLDGWKAFLASPSHSRPLAPLTGPSWPNQIRINQSRRRLAYAPPASQPASQLAGLARTLANITLAALFRVNNTQAAGRSWSESTRSLASPWRPATTGAHLRGP